MQAIAIRVEAIAVRVEARSSLLLLVGWRPSLLKWRPPLLLVGWRPCY